MPELLQACAIVATPLFVIGAYIVATAPLGWEDEVGFHTGLRDLREDHAQSDTVA